MAHSIPVGEKPYQVSFTRSFAYIRSLGTPEVGLIPMSELDGPKTPPVSYIMAGQGAPGTAAEISIADSIVPSVKHAAAYIVNQAEGTVHYYMEGMGAPMGAFRNYGHETRAIEIVDRSLGERQPGVYAGRVRLPVEGTYNVAFMMDAPRFVHCFSATVEPNPEMRAATAPMAIEYQIADRRVPAGKSTAVKFKLTDPVTGKPRERCRRRDRALLRRRRARPHGGAGPGARGRPVRGRRQGRPGDHLLPVRGVALPAAEIHGPAVCEPDGDTAAPVRGGGAKAGAAGSP